MTFTHKQSVRWQLLFTAGTMVSSVTSVLAAATGGLALSASGARLAVAIAGALPIGAVVLGVLLLDQDRRWRGASEALGLQ